MCGVIGYVPPAASTTPDSWSLVGAFRSLMVQSRIRGTHAYGLAQSRAVFRGDVETLVDFFDPARPAVAHARYSTSGDWTVPENNQPIAIGDTALAFNGVIDMGTKEEFEQRWGVKCDTANDGELFLRRTVAPEEFVRTMQGSFAGVWVHWSRGETHLMALRNERRPLWSSSHLGALWYASTKDIFRRAGFSDVRSVEPLRLESTVWSVVAV